MKELYLLRHGPALPRGARGIKSDAARPLSPEGRRKVRRIAGALRQQGLVFDLLLSSPFARARETAEIVAGELDLEDRLQFTDRLAARGDTGALIEELAKLPSRLESVLLVGHEPDLSRLVSLLVAGHLRLGLTLKKGGLCKVEVRRLRPDRDCTLELLLTPRLLLALR
jgi:phosphohistidine phosphatase